MMFFFYFSKNLRFFCLDENPLLTRSTRCRVLLTGSTISLAQVLFLLASVKGSLTGVGVDNTVAAMAVPTISFFGCGGAPAAEVNVVVAAANPGGAEVPANVPFETHEDLMAGFELVLVTRCCWSMAFCNALSFFSSLN